MTSPRMKKYLSVVWLYSIGVSVIILGLVFVYQNPGPSGIMVMLAGLAVSGVGAARGRKIMLSGEEFAEPPKAEDVRVTGSPSARKPGPSAREPAAPVDINRIPPKPFQPVFRGIRRVVENMPRNVPRAESAAEPARTKEEAMEEELTPSTEEAHVEYREKIVKIIICPKCGTENSEIAKYCYNCGKKLRTRTVK
jgi:ribosomal protein L40E